ncbi:MAG: hypothetical protein PHU71_05000 [Candidatus Gracilibacteria bacterium]|nr:hypothetical protein [Candidatus Gracilibacteria bacterium]
MTETIPVEDAESIMRDIQKRPDWQVFLIEGPRSKFSDTLILQDKQGTSQIIRYASNEFEALELRNAIRSINPQKIQYNY